MSPQTLKHDSTRVCKLFVNTRKRCFFVVHNFSCGGLVWHIETHDSIDDVGMCVSIDDFPRIHWAWGFFDTSGQRVYQLIDQSQWSLSQRKKNGESEMHGLQLYLPKLYCWQSDDHPHGACLGDSTEEQKWLVSSFLSWCGVFLIAWCLFLGWTEGRKPSSLKFEPADFVIDWWEKVWHFEFQKCLAFGLLCRLLEWTEFGSTLMLLCDPRHWPASDDAFCATMSKIAEITGLCSQTAPESKTAVLWRQVPGLMVASRNSIHVTTITDL